MTVGIVVQVIIENHEPRAFLSTCAILARMQNVTQLPERSLALRIFAKGGWWCDFLSARLRGRVWRYIIMGRSSTRSLDDVGTASCFTVSSLRYGSRPSYHSLYSYVPRLHGQIVKWLSVIGVPARPNRRLVLGDWCSCTALRTAKSSISSL